MWYRYCKHRHTLQLGNEVEFAYFWNHLPFQFRLIPYIQRIWVKPRKSHRVSKLDETRILIIFSMINLLLICFELGDKFYLVVQQKFFIFIPTWGNDPIWLILFRWVGSTTNQNCIEVFLFAGGFLQIYFHPDAHRPFAPWIRVERCWFGQWNSCSQQS